jgi:transcription initiation factor IIE alpha subunit
MNTPKNGQTIPCPTCTTPISFDIKQLLDGVEFTCPNCQQSIGLAPDSKDKVKETLNRFDDIKGRIEK